MSSHESLDLFSMTPLDSRASKAPLAERMRPRSLEEVLGQEELLAPKAALSALVESSELPSLILWGPPGVGKTTIAQLLAKSTEKRWIAHSAVSAGVKEIRAAIATAEVERARGGSTALFLDEIHRLNKSQQDVLLPHVEAGTLTLIGATTENPSFEVNNALLSRCRVFTLKALGEEALKQLLQRALSDEERGLGKEQLELPDAALTLLYKAADGDARRALGLLEASAALHRINHPDDPVLSAQSIEQASGDQTLRYDRAGEEHYNVISAFIKSMRASDPDAALYYLARMLEGGEDPLFIARRLVIFASEDVGNAEPAGLSLATSTHLALERIGLPEGRINLAQTVAFLSCAPKSNAAYAAYEQAAALVRQTGSLSVPKHLCNAPTKLMKQLGYSKGYQYPHDKPDEDHAGPHNLPDELPKKRFFTPGKRGWEARAAERRKGSTP
jgi:putative ATPase